MVKVGFIVEGASEKFLVESDDFRNFLIKNKIDYVPFTANVEGNSNLLPDKLPEYTEFLKAEGATHFIVLTDLEHNASISAVKDRINAPKDHVVVISVKAIEAWYLADSRLLTTLFKKNYNYQLPEQTAGMPIDTLRDEFVTNTGRGFGRSKPKLALRMVNSGFSVVNAAAHENCPSAKFFLATLQEIAKQ